MASSNSNSNDSNVSRIVNHIVRPLRPVYDNRIINHRPLYYPRPVFVSPKNINYRGGHPILSRRRASGDRKGRRPSHRGGINGPNFRPSRPSPLSKVTMAYQDDDSLKSGRAGRDGEDVDMEMEDFCFQQTGLGKSRAH